MQEEHGQWSSKNKKGTRPLLILATRCHTTESVSSLLRQSYRALLFKLNYPDQKKTTALRDGDHASSKCDRNKEQVNC